MGKISYSLVYNRKKKLNKKGNALVQVEAYLNRRKIYFSTRVYLRPEQWDTKRRMVKEHPNKEALNRMLYGIVAILEQKELELWQQGKTISLELLKDTVTKSTTDSRNSFLTFVKEEIKNSGKGMTPDAASPFSGVLVMPKYENPAKKKVNFL